MRLAYPNLEEYSAGAIGHEGDEAPLGADMFGCHTSPTDPPALCAGWLAIVGRAHLTIRVAILWGYLPEKVLQAGPHWPELFTTYEEMISNGEKRN